MDDMDEEELQKPNTTKRWEQRAEQTETTKKIHNLRIITGIAVHILRMYVCLRILGSCKVQDSPDLSDWFM